MVVFLLCCPSICCFAMLMLGCCKVHFPLSAAFVRFCHNESRDLLLPLCLLLLSLEPFAVCITILPTKNFIQVAEVSFSLYILALPGPASLYPHRCTTLEGQQAFLRGLSPSLSHALPKTLICWHQPGGNPFLKDPSQLCGV